MFYFLDMRRAMSGVGKPPLARGREAKEESSRHTSRESHTGERSHWQSHAEILDKSTTVAPNLTAMPSQLEVRISQDGFG